MVCFVIKVMAVDKNKNVINPLISCQVAVVVTLWGDVVAAYGSWDHDYV